MRQEATKNPDPTSAQCLHRLQNPFPAGPPFPRPGFAACALFSTLWLLLVNATLLYGANESPFLIPSEGQPEQVMIGLGCAAPTAMAFDSHNRPYLMSMTYASQYGFILTLDDNGNWVQRSYMPALRAWNPGASLPPTTTTNLHAVGYLAVDSEDALYAVLRTYVNGTGNSYVLLYSTNAGLTFQVYTLPAPREANYLKLEQYTGRNCLPYPPAIAIAQYRAPYTNSDWASYNNFSVLLPSKTSTGLNLGPSILVSTNSNGFVSHSGSSSFAFSTSNLVHVTYLNVPNGETNSDNPIYVATLDRAMGTVLARQHVANALSSDADKVDVHCCPVIAGDQKGCLHVVAGAHNKPFYYTRSLVAGSITNGWTAPEAMNSIQTYATLVCDSGDRLFSIYRTIPLFYFQDRDAADNAGWSARKQLTTLPPEYSAGGGYYTIYYHRLFMDRGDALFASFTLYWVGTGAVVHSAYPRILAMSEDGGVTWQLATRQRLFERMVRKPSYWIGPPNGSDDWNTGTRWSDGAPCWGDTAIFNASGNYTPVAAIGQNGRFSWAAMQLESNVPAFGVSFSVWNPSGPGTLIRVAPGVTTDHTIDAGRGTAPFQVNLRDGTNTIQNDGSGLLSIGSSQRTGSLRALYGRASLVIDGSGNTRMGGVYTPTGRMTLASAGGSLDLIKRGTGLLTLNNTNAHSSTTVERGLLRAMDENNNATTGGTVFGTLSAPLLLNGGTVDLSLNASIAPYSTTVGGDATILSSRATPGSGVIHTLGSLTVGTNTLTIGAGTNVTGGTPALVFGTTTLKGDANFRVEEAGVPMTLFLGAVGESGSGRSLIKNGLGTLTCFGPNTYTGNTLVNEGTLAYPTNMGLNATVFSGAGAVRLGSTASSLRVNPNARFGAAFNGCIEIAAGATVTAFISPCFSNNVSRLNASPAAQFSINGSTMGFGALTGSGTIQNTAGGTFAPAFLTIGANDANGSFSGQINSGSLVNGAISLTKIGSGVQRLLGNCNYTGPTVISNGVLVVNGSLAPASFVTVEPNGTLGGTGTVNGSVTVRGNLAPGDDAVGTLVTGSQSWQNGGSMVLRMTGATNNALRGMLSVTGTLDLQLSGSGKFTIKLISMLSSNLPGPLPDFDPASRYTWPAVTASGGVLHFDPSRLEVDAALFANGYKGTFSITNIGNKLAVIYEPASQAPPVISGQTLLPNGSFELTFSGRSGQPFRVLGTNLLIAPAAAWPVLMSGTFDDSAATNFIDTEAQNSSNTQRFYRVVSP